MNCSNKSEQSGTLTNAVLAQGSVLAENRTASKKSGGATLITSLTTAVADEGLADYRFRFIKNYSVGKRRFVKLT